MSRGFLSPALTSMSARRRRLRLLRPGVFVIVGTLVLGLAALNTGNNLLFLLLGALLGTIAISGWLSEQALRDVSVTRVLPRCLTTGATGRIEYRVRRAARTPAYALRVHERVAPAGVPRRYGVEAGVAFLPVVHARAESAAHADLHARQRGEYTFERVTVATSFPFGLFRKERDIVLPGALLVWPRTDRRVRPPLPAGRASARHALAGASAAGAGRGDYRSLREYRAGDDPRDLHWRATARRGLPVVREYDRSAADEYWIVLDPVAPDAAAGEAAVETAAALMALAADRRHPAGLAAGAARLRPGEGAASLEAALDVLATVQITAEGPFPEPPGPPASCVLVTARAASGAWGDVYHVRADAP